MLIANLCYTLLTFIPKKSMHICYLQHTNEVFLTSDVKIEKKAVLQLKGSIADKCATIGKKWYYIVIVVYFFCLCK